jgi:hypothetical protein
MPVSPFSIDGIALCAGLRRPWSTQTKLASVFAVGMVLLASARAEAGFLDIGSVNTFATSSSGGNPTGTWTLEDKDWTYLDSTGTWTGVEDIQLTTNFDPGVFSHQFLVTNLGSYHSPQTLTLGYQVHINGSLGPGWTFYDVRLGVNTSGATVDVWKDIYYSLADYTANTGTGTGTVKLHSLDGSLAPAEVFPPGLIDLWVRDTVTLSGVGGSLSSFGDTFRQSVPEIDPNSFASAFALLIGSLGLLERRTRRVRAIWLG